MTGFLIGIVALGIAAGWVYKHLNMAKKQVHAAWGDYPDRYRMPLP